MSDPELSLAAEFPPADRDAWLKLVAGVLKGAPFERRLVSRTYDGIAIEPLYARDETARPIVGRTPGAPWQVLSRIEHPDPVAANAQALVELENGATGLSLVFAGSIGAFGFGLDARADGGRVAAARHSSRCRDRPRYRGRRPARKHRVRGDRGRRRPRHRTRRRRHPLRVRSDRHHRHRRPRAVMVRGPRAGRPADPRARRSGLSRPVRGGRRPRHSQCRRIGGAGARLRDRDGARLSARARGERRAARRGAAHDLFPPRRRRRPVPDHGKIPRATGIVGAGRSGVRTRAAAGLRRGADGVAHDDEARPVREHAAFDHGGGGRRPRRRRRHHRAAAHRSHRPAGPLCPPHRAQYPAHPSRGIEPRQGRRSRRRLRRVREL